MEGGGAVGLGQGFEWKVGGGGDGKAGEEERNGRGGEA